MSAPVDGPVTAHFRHKGVHHLVQAGRALGQPHPVGVCGATVGHRAWQQQSRHQSWRGVIRSYQGAGAASVTGCVLTWPYLGRRGSCCAESPWLGSPLLLAHPHSHKPLQPPRFRWGYLPASSAAGSCSKQLLRNSASFLPCPTPTPWKSRRPAVTGKYVQSQVDEQ